MAAGIFLISAATLLFELSLTRIFSVLFYHHFAFLIVSTALFGFGFSGVYLFFFPVRPDALRHRLSWSALLFSVTILLVYAAILFLPYRHGGVIDDPRQVIRLVLNYALLIVPFFFSGYVIGLILSSFPEKAGTYYFFDLAGAAAGCAGVVWLVPAAGASGAVVIASTLASMSAVCLSSGNKHFRWAAVALTAILCAGSFRAEQYLALQMPQIFKEKHGMFFQAPKRKIEFSAWSPVSRIDVLVTPPNRLLYLDGGSNVSFFMRFNGDVSRLQPRMNWRSVPYLITPRSSVCIIGPGGGEDVLNALSHRVASITAVEMDPLIVEAVKGRYADFTGRIFHHPSVDLINDEGRSYLRRSGRTFDLIQTVHNCSPMALAAGALNLSESYLFTVEAFQEYWDRLNPGGMLSIHRTGILRAASLASVVLQRNGIQDPENYVAATTQKRGHGTGFYLKKGRFDEKDLQVFRDLEKTLGVRLAYVPEASFQTAKNVYYRLLKPSLREDFIREADLVLEASTDDWPFFEHHQRIGSFRKSTTILPEEFNRGLKFYNLGDLALFAVLAEAIVLSFLFILLPLIRVRKLKEGSGGWAVLCYFSSLGLGFILIEISLFQKHILFMGQPVYSIATVLFSLLFSAGIGSFIFQRFFREGKEKTWITIALTGIFLMLLFEVFAVPRLFSYFLGAGKEMRFVLSGLFIAPLGIMLGIPFPLGIRFLSRRSPDLIPWGWGVNAYMTVVGSVLSIIFALLLGFKMNFAISALIYGIAGVAFLAMLRRQRVGAGL